MDASRSEHDRPARRVLLVDAKAEDRALVAEALAPEGVEVLEAADRAALEAALEGADFELLITEHELDAHGCDGLAVLRASKARDPERPVVMFTGSGSEQLAVEALQAGLDDYVVKSPRQLGRLRDAVRAALEQAERRGAARRTEETLRSLKKAIDTLPIGVTIADVHGRIVYTNPAEAQLHGYTVEELLGREARMLVPSDYWQPMEPEQIRELRPWKRERINVRKDGSTFPAQLISDVVRNAAGEPIGIVTTCEDISERKRIEEQLRRSAFYDPLTGLPNRALFLDRLGRTLQRARRRAESLFAVLFLDLDRFKLVNDSFGHSVGDRLLAESARRLQRALRPSDTVARLGGDEFAILAEEIRDVGDAIAIAQRAQLELSQPHQLGGHDVLTTASIGIALSTVAYADPEQVLRDADAAMYRAKAKGRACHEIFGEDMLLDARGWLRLEADLRQALERDELLLHFQPIVSLVSGAPTGAEALVRWRHPERGLLLPEQFIPVAEETGLIAPLGRWVLSEACARAREWRAQGLGELRVSVNLSARQFRQEGLTQLVRRAVLDSGLPPGALTLELTESTLMENLPDSVRHLEELKAFGASIAIDDFGTGYSSLSYLKQFPVDALKIDQSFVEHVTTDARDAAIVSSVIALAHNLRLEVVAEGVETEAQLEFLERERCEAVQGNVFSGPLPTGAIEQALKSGLVRTPGGARPG